MTVASPGRIVLTRFGTEQVRSLLYHITINATRRCPLRSQPPPGIDFPHFAQRGGCVSSQLIPSDPCKITLRDCRNPHSATHPPQGTVNLRFHLDSLVTILHLFRTKVSWRSNILFIIYNYALFSRKKEFRTKYFIRKIYFINAKPCKKFNLSTRYSENLIRAIFTRSAQTEQMSP